MKQERSDHEKIYYITKVFTSAEGTRPPCGKEMDSARYHCSVPEGISLPKQYENGSPDGQIILHYVEEEVSYMADYEADENDEIKMIRYDKVPVVGSARNKILIIKKEGVAPDTP